MPLKYIMLQTIGSKSTRHSLTIKMLCSGQEFHEKNAFNNIPANRKHLVFVNKDGKVKKSLQSAEQLTIYWCVS